MIAQMMKFPNPKNQEVNKKSFNDIFKLISLLKPHTKQIDLKIGSKQIEKIRVNELLAYYHPFNQL